MMLLADAVKAHTLEMVVLTTSFLGCLIATVCPAHAPAHGRGRAHTHAAQRNMVFFALVAKSSFIHTLLSRSQASDLFAKDVHQVRSRGQTPKTMTRTATLTGVPVALQSGRREGLVLKADQIVFVCAFDPAQIDLAIVNWLQKLRLIIPFGDASDMMHQRTDTSINIKNLTCSKLVTALC